MLLGTMRLLSIKDLKDLRFPRSGDYRHAGPKGPEEKFFTGAIAGDRPPRYGEKMGTCRWAAPPDLNGLRVGETSWSR